MLWFLKCISKYTLNIYRRCWYVWFCKVYKTRHGGRTNWTSVTKRLRQCLDIHAFYHFLHISQASHMRVNVKKCIFPPGGPSPSHPPLVSTATQSSPLQTSCQTDTVVKPSGAPRGLLGLPAPVTAPVSASARPRFPWSEATSRNPEWAGPIAQRDTPLRWTGSTGHIHTGHIHTGRSRRDACCSGEEDKYRSLKITTHACGRGGEFPGLSLKGDRTKVPCSVLLSYRPAQQLPL